MSRSKSADSSDRQQPAEPVVYIVDDDISVRESLGNLMRSVGLQAQLFSSAFEFRRHGHAAGPACLVLDVRLPGMSGLDLQAELTSLGEKIPIIFITGHGDVPMSVRAMKSGAVEFLLKPFREQDLLDAIHLALSKYQPGSVLLPLPETTPVQRPAADHASVAPAAEAAGASSHSPRQALARNMQLARAIFNWSQEELGSRCGLYRSHISAVEREELSVGVDAIDGIAAAFAVSPHVMLMPPREAQAQLLEAFNGNAQKPRRPTRGGRS